ncbi:MAG: 3-oxoacyl-[acyl-carrier-protein] synthase [Solirubrobacteraceae bacterium]|nr:3-oxoacyl-[acyl-carrier-protein] synthase [Solirubrobacteraceae bacterium]
MKAGVFGIGAALPEEIVTNADLEKNLDTTDAWIVRRTGIRERRHLNGSRTLADLAAEACTMALRDAGRDAADVDRVMVCSLTPDRMMPGLAPAVAQQIGCNLAGAVDLNAACAGFLYALDHAAALVESERAKLVVVCGAEALSRITDHTDRGTAILFADGAGAVVVAAGDLDRGLSTFELRSDGRHSDLLYVDMDERLLRMEGREVYRHAVARMVEATEVALTRAGIGIDDVDVFVAHQANARIIEAAARRLGVPEEKVVINVDTVANTSSASIPIALWQAEREGRLKPGDIVAMATFGAGFAWGAGVMSWKERVHATA